MNCNKCGQILDSNVQFCSNCGNKITNIPAPKTKDKYLSALSAAVFSIICGAASLWVLPYILGAMGISLTLVAFKDSKGKADVIIFAIIGLLICIASIGLKSYFS